MTPRARLEPHPLAVAVGAALRDARLARGLSLRAAAHAAGVSRSVVARLERGRVVSFIAVFRVADAVGLGRQELRNVIGRVPIGEPVAAA